jgi:hypothetical protein
MTLANAKTALNAPKIRGSCSSRVTSEITTGLETMIPLAPRQATARPKMRKFMFEADLKDEDDAEIDPFRQDDSEELSNRQHEADLCLDGC